MPKERKELAEQNGDFIRFLQKTCNSYEELGPAEKNRKGQFKFQFKNRLKGGLYVIYLAPEDNEDLKLPIYVGITKREFRIRFNDKDLNRVFEWFDPSKFDLYAVVCSLSNSKAKISRKFLLRMFNFIRNRKGSDNIRNSLDYEETYSWKESLEMLKTKHGKELDGIVWDEIGMDDNEE